MSTFQSSILELIRRTSAYLPRDVEEVIELKAMTEQKESRAALAMEIVGQNIKLAKQKSLPICQDTGTITFYIETPVGFDQLQLREDCEAAVVEATEKGFLRQNTVDALTGENSGNNLGEGSPVFHFEQTRESCISIRLILKGGGCENMSRQYSLPCTIGETRADRNLAGVRACILDAVWQAQGKGCGPGFLGVSIGGDRATGYEHAKKQLLRTVDDTNENLELSQLEAQILDEANQLKIGPMGFSGNFTLGGCKIGSCHRLPASFFVSVAYMCWAYRRRGVVLDEEGAIVNWLYSAEGETFDIAKKPEPIAVGGDAKRLQLPLSEADVRELKAGDMVLLSGKMFTGRDEVHKYLFDGGSLPKLQGGVLYHCGPVMLEEDGEYSVIAAGPTTSIREEPYQWRIIEDYNLRAVIGKGGMGRATQEACKKHGCVYLHAIGGAAQIYAQCITKVYGVELLEFGSPEAVWELEVKDFPVVVSIDTHGVNLQELTQQQSQEHLSSLLNPSHQTHSSQKPLVPQT